MERTAQLGFYLVPPYSLAREVLLMRGLAYDQYRVAAAQSFMIHVTIIGFFKLTETMTYDIFISSLDRELSTFSAFRIFPDRVAALDNGLGLVFARERNRELYRLQSACYDAVKHAIARDARMPRTAEADEDFHAHMTVSMVDASPETLEEMEAYFSDAEFALGGYVASTLKLYEFTSDLWHAPDAWIHNMRWRSLRTWRLTDTPNASGER